ncbi:MAG: hypothetical protein Q8R92_06835, partial [Deltaproteobacteria bacterium]|nr:hypothetical protein [Deltaproteobacteria bacterium]
SPLAQILADGIRLEYRDLATLLRAPRNPKGHDLGAIQASLDRFGFVSPIIVDDATGRLVAGHGRVDALQQRKASGQPPPARIKVEGDRWLVPVVAGVAFRSPVEAESFLIADNQTTILGAWDEQELAALLSDLAAQDCLTGTGFGGDDVDALLSELTREAEKAAGVDLDESIADNVKMTTCPKCGEVFPA